MTSFLCLAHFCEVHGPTPLMVTEGLPVKCSACDESDTPDLISVVTAATAAAAASTAAGKSAAGRASASVARQTSSHTSSPSSATSTVNYDAGTSSVAETMCKMTLDSSRWSSKPNRSHESTEQPDTPDGSSVAQAQQTYTAARGNSPQASAQQKQASITQPSQKTHFRSDSANHFRKTYDESVTKRAIPCDNCSMSLTSRRPRRDSYDSANSKDTLESAPDARSTTLRTRVPCARVYDDVPAGGAGDASPFVLHPSSPSVSSASSSDAEGDEKQSWSSSRIHGRSHRRSDSRSLQVPSRSSTSSSASRLVNSHTHYIDYTSTHEPSSANAYYLIRASCLRTLTLETLPAAGATPTGAGPQASSLLSPLSAPSPPIHGHMASSYFASPPRTPVNNAAASAAAANGGPLFFGDPTAGYTTAHVFRVPDMHARGHKRVYALIALTTNRERLAMKAFGYLSAAFSELVVWIQQLAAAEAERIALQSDSNTDSSPSGAASPLTGTNLGGSALSGSPRTGHLSAQVSHSSSLASESTSGQGSSFLTAAGNGLSRRMGPGYAGFGGLGSSAMASLRARGLPDILGRPEFFVELHAHFVTILLELGVLLSS